MNSSLPLKAFTSNHCPCRGGNTVAFAKRLNFHQNKTVLVAVLESIARLKGIKDRTFIPTVDGADRSKSASGKKQFHDVDRPLVLADGVVSVTGSDSKGRSSMSSRIDWARW